MRLCACIKWIWLAHQRHTHEHMHTHTRSHTLWGSLQPWVWVCVCVWARIKQDHPAWGAVVMHNDPPLLPIGTFSIVLAQGSDFPLSRKNLLTSQQQCDWRVFWRFCREIREGYCITYCTSRCSNLYPLVHFSSACSQWVSLSCPLKLSFLGVQSLSSKMFLRIPYLIPCFQLLPANSHNLLAQKSANQNSQLQKETRRHRK